MSENFRKSLNKKVGGQFWFLTGMNLPVPQIRSTSEEIPMNELHTTAWLAKRLGLSIKTIERMRSQQSAPLPPYVIVGHSIRYDEAQVEAWISEQQLEKTAKTTQKGVTS